MSIGHTAGPMLLHPVQLPQARNGESLVAGNALGCGGLITKGGHNRCASEDGRRPQVSVSRLLVAF